jgi:hypothetical protein
MYFKVIHGTPGCDSKYIATYGVNSPDVSTVFGPVMGNQHKPSSKFM